MFALFNSSSIRQVMIEKTYNSLILCTTWHIGRCPDAMLLLILCTHRIFLKKVWKLKPKWKPFLPTRTIYIENYKLKKIISIAHKLISIAHKLIRKEKSIVHTKLLD